MRTSVKTLGLSLLLASCVSPSAQPEPGATGHEQLVRQWWAIIDRHAEKAYETCKQTVVAQSEYHGAEAIATPELLSRVSRRLQPCYRDRYERTITSVRIGADVTVVEASITTLQPTSVSEPAFAQAAARVGVQYRYVIRSVKGKLQIADVLRRAASPFDGAPLDHWEVLYAPSRDSPRLQPFYQ